MSLRFQNFTYLSIKIWNCQKYPTSFCFYGVGEHRRKLRIKFFKKNAIQFYYQFWKLKFYFTWKRMFYCRPVCLEQFTLLWQIHWAQENLLKWYDYYLLYAQPLVIYLVLAKIHKHGTLSIVQLFTFMYNDHEDLFDFLFSLEC